MTVQLIAHALFKREDRYLVIKRSLIKRGQPNVYPGYWDILGGRVEELEVPQAAAIRETREESGQEIAVKAIIWEDSQLDCAKGQVFTRLVYEAELLQERPVVLDPEEHMDYRWISSLADLEGQAIVPYLTKILGKTK